MEGAQGAAEAAKFILVGYDIRPSGQHDPSSLTVSAVGSIGAHLSSAHVAGAGQSNDEAVVVDGYDLQSRVIASFMEGVELILCLVTEELEIRVVHVAGRAGWVHTRETVVDAEWEAYVGNVAT